jgi:hypothetical protein
MYEETFFAIPPVWMLVLTVLLPLLVGAVVRVRRPDPITFASAVVGGALVAAVVLGTVAGTTYRRLLYENGPVEIWTALLLAGAGCVAWRARARMTHPLGRLVAAGAAVVLVLASAEELSWGQNLFQWSSPEWFFVTNEQHETNMHNITGRLLDTKAVTILGLLAFAIVVPFVARRKLDHPFVRQVVAPLAPPVNLTPHFVVSCVLCIDLPTGFEAELGECLAALLIGLAMSQAGDVAGVAAAESVSSQPDRARVRAIRARRRQPGVAIDVPTPASSPRVARRRIDGRSTPVSRRPWSVWRRLGHRGQ